MSIVNAEIKWQSNDDAWFTTNAAEVFAANIQIFHVDGRYKFTDGVTALNDLPWRGIIHDLQSVTDNGNTTSNEIIASSFSSSTGNFSASETNLIQMNSAGDNPLFDADTTNDTVKILGIDVAVVPVEKSANFTAQLGFKYVITTSCTVTDPSPSQGKGFEVIVRNGTATVGGVGYSVAGTRIYRYYHSGVWATYYESGTNTGNETTSTLGATINGAAAATPNDTDSVATVESSVVKKITWANVKAFLKTYFDTLYQSISNLVTSWSNSTSDTKYPSEKLVKDSLNDAINQFRLTLTSGVAVTTGDVTGATTIYCTPFNGNKISLYNGSQWIIYTSNEFSLALGTLTNKKLYDVFCYANSGVPTLEFLVWTNDTTRSTALTTQNGILVKSGDATRRYLGTFYNQGNQSSTVTITNASPAVITYTGHGLTANTPVVFTTTGSLPSGIVSGQTYYIASLGTATANKFSISATPGGALINTSTAGSGTHTCTISTYTEDSLANRYLWNYYNKSLRRMFVKENTASWDYTTNTARQVNANILNQLNFIQGLDNIVQASYKTRCGNSSANVGVIISTALDSITTANFSSVLTIASAAIGNSSWVSCDFLDYTGVGKHYIAMLEQSSATGTTRWSSGGAALSTSITGQILC